MKQRLIAAGCFGLLIYALLPASIVAINDDFGYLRSVVETIQHGRPWTNDWLEPWAATLSSSAALLYATSGSFYAATYGLLSVLGAISFFALATLLGTRTSSEKQRLAVTALILTSATLLWKNLEFTSVAVYAPCLFVALWAAEQRRWALFTMAWALALGSRQSALTWGILPAIQALANWRRPRELLPAVLSGTAGLAVFILLDRTMNVTHAQAVITHQLFAAAHLPQAARALGVVITVIFVAVGLAAFTWNYVPKS